MDDNQVIEAQIGRAPRADSQVVDRCHLGLPVVIRVPPLLDDGTPFPTLFWLACPLATARVGRLESTGGVSRMEQKAGADAEFGAALEQAHRSYAQQRDALVPPGASPVPTGGVGGARAGVKCLHAHYAHHRAGGNNPVGQIVASWVEPLDCEVECVVDGARNPKWGGKP